MQKKSTCKRLFSLLMALALLLSAFPATFAETGEATLGQATATDLETDQPTEIIPTEIPTTEDEAPTDAPMVNEPTAAPDTGTEEPSQEPPDEPVEAPSSPLQQALDANGFAYLTTAADAAVYAAADGKELVFTVTQTGSVLLATGYELFEDTAMVKVWLLTEAQEVLTGFAHADVLTDSILTEEAVQALTETVPALQATTDAGDLLVFTVAGEKPTVSEEPPVTETPTEEPATEIPPDAPATEIPTEEAPTETPTTTEQPSDESQDEILDAVPTAEEIPAVIVLPPDAQAGDFVAVTTKTCVFTDVDESAEDDYDGDLCQGVFVRDAVVQVENVSTDSQNRHWCHVRHLFGDDHADGTLKWTDTATLWILANESDVTDAAACTVTDYAFQAVPSMLSSARAVTAMNGFSLKNINVSIPTFYAGQTNLYGSSGKDSDYLQIAKDPSKGTIYATPHYLDGFSVYCLEHNLPGPGENISGGGQQPKGPYMIVDIDTYRNTPGYSSIIYNDATLHELAWVIRHSYPFMALDRSDSDNLTWSRVAGQFAIRQVIREMEGAQYVRSYWNMDNFYVASGQAPSVYLAYARWLAENGIARGRITGKITVSGKTVSVSGSSYVGQAKLTTDADKIRIRKSYGTITGNSAGSDATYYYLNSGDTISITSGMSSFSVVAESMSSDSEEASFLVGVPRTEIQKVIIPQYGAPYKMKSVTLSFEIPYGSISVTKKGSDISAGLVGAVFELLNSAGAVLQTQTIGTNGVATFSNVQPGSYTVREKTAPQGYTLGVASTQNVTVTAGAASSLTFTNEPISEKIKIVKKDQLTKEPLAGVEFTVTRLSASASKNGAGVGTVVAVLTTDANGEAMTGWLDWGKYRVAETKVPQHYVNSGFSVDINAYENGKTYTVEVENEPTKGYIKLTKTNRQDSKPIAGVQFDIFYNDAFGTGLAGTMTTDASGVAVSPALRKGSYIVREHGDPTGYVTALIELSATVAPDETTTLSATNQPIQGYIQIVKRDELTKELLAGAEFTITRISGLPSHNGSNDGAVVAVITTDANGLATSPLLTWGTYRVTETKVPEHFVDNHFSTEVTISEDNLRTYTIEVENEPTKGWIRLTKADRLNGNPIEGVQFDIFYHDEYGEGLAATMTTNKDGIAISEALRKGRYIVREHSSTAGYLFEEVTLDVTMKSDETSEVSATNRPVTARLKLYKRDVDEFGDLTSAPTTRGDGVLIGAEYQVRAGEEILDRQGNRLFTKGDVVVETLKTAGEDASVTTDELWPGLYEIVETKAPIGYLLNSTPILVDARDAAKQSAEAVITYEGVIADEISYGLQAIIKFKGDNQIHDDAGIIETPEEGAEFELYLKKAGSFDAAREPERDYLVTSETGYAVSKLLPYGVYTFKQVKAAPGYAIKSPMDIMIDGDEDAAKPPILIINNEAVRYRLKFIKTDAETGKTIAVANTTFKLKDADGSYITQTVHYPTQTTIDTFMTDANGEVTLPETVTYGMYYVEEFTAPAGYLILTEDFGVFVGDDTMNQPGEVYLLEIRIPNDPVKGEIILEKKGLLLTGFEMVADEHGNEVHQPLYEERYLAGTVFEVRAATEIVGKDGTVWFAQDELVDTLTMTADAPVRSKTLPLGSYYLTEIETPLVYIMDVEKHTFDLTFADNHTALVETTAMLTNTYLPAEITLRKEKEATEAVTNGDTVRQRITNVPGEGFVFGLYNATDIRWSDGTLMADTLIAAGATDAEGKLTFSGNYPHGSYYIKELSVPDGWKLNPTQFPVLLDPAQATDIIRVELPEAVHNELIYTNITLTKQDITGEETVPGAVIEVRNEAGEVIYRAVTDENGEIPDISVVPGSYTFHEVLAPSGYALNEAIMTFTVDADGRVTGDTIIRDDYTRIHVQKQNETGKPLAGVEFSLLDKEGKTIMTALSDASGLVTFERIPYGSYAIVESKALSGYVLDKTTIPLVVDGHFVNSDAPIATITIVLFVWSLSRWIRRASFSRAWSLA